MHEWEGELIKQYIVETRLGTGSQSVVYQARHRETEDLVAIKFWSHAISQSELIQDIDRIKKLDHPHIIKIYDTGFHQRTVYMIMQLARGGTLEDLFAQTRRTKLVDSLQVLQQIAQALDYLHQNGVVHRDLKPSNILLDDRGYGYLSDFGLVNFMESSPELMISPQEDLRGTVAYMAPEIWLGQPVGPWTDIYALGMIIYQTLVGYPPFAAANQLGTAFAHVNTPLPPISKANPQFPVATDDIIARATAKNPQHRYSSASQFITDLYQALQPWLDQHLSTDLKNVAVSPSENSLFSTLLETVQVPTDTNPLIPGYTVLHSLTNAQKGGMADLYVARRDNHPPNERYVIKIPRIKIDGPGGDAFSVQFKHEIELLHTLDHPALIKIVAYGECEIKGSLRPYFVTPYMEGGDLRDRLNSGQVFTLTEISTLLQRVGEALDYAFQKNGTIHLDIKPDNLLFNRQGQVVLTDFGLGHNQELTLVESFMFAGTIHYCSPEQLTKRRDQLDQRADVYAAGILLFEMLSGQRPFVPSTSEGHDLSPVEAGKKKYEIIHAHLFAPVPSIFDQLPALKECAPEIQLIINKALAKKAEDRFATVSQLALAIRAMLPPVIPEIGAEISLLANYSGYGLYRAKWRGRQVIIQLFKDATGSPAVQKALAKHTQLLHQLEKEHIAFVHTHGFDTHQRPYLVWDNPGGSSLKDRLQVKGRLSLKESKTIIRSLAQAVDHAHERGLAHLNIRPEMILMDAAAKPSLIAFDLPLPHSQANSTPLVDGYLSPEQQTNHAPTRQTDVYYAGLTLFTLLTGVPRFPASTNGASFQFSNSESRLSPKVQNILNKATAHDPGQRYESVSDLAKALEQVTSFDYRTLLIPVFLAVCLCLFLSFVVPEIILTSSKTPTPIVLIAVTTTFSPTPSPIASKTPTLSHTPEPSPTWTPTATPTGTPIPTRTFTPTPTPSPSPTETATPSRPRNGSITITLERPVGCAHYDGGQGVEFAFYWSGTINSQQNYQLLLRIYRKDRPNREPVYTQPMANERRKQDGSNLWVFFVPVEEFYENEPQTNDYVWDVVYLNASQTVTESSGPVKGCFQYVPNNSVATPNKADPDK